MILTFKSFALGERVKDKPNHLTAGSLFSFPQDSQSSTASSGKANDWRDREHVVLDWFSNLQ